MASVKLAMHRAQVMKIAIYHNLPSGGAKRALFEAVRHLSVKHQFDGYTTSAANHEFADLRPYAAVYRIYPFQPGGLYNSPFGRLNMLVRSRDLSRIQTLNKKIALDIDQQGYDLVFVNPCQIEVAPSLLSFIKRSPTLYYCQEPPRILYEEMPKRPYSEKSPRDRLMDRLDPFPDYFYRRLQDNDRRNIQSADLVLVNSEFMRNNVAKIYGNNPQVCYLGTDAVLFRPLYQKRERAVLSVGSLTPLKNFDFIIQALGTIPENQRPPLWLASNFQNSPERAYLEALAAQLGVTVKFFGNIDDQELVRLYNSASVTVYTPIREPFGLVPLESMACETPVVTVSEGGMAETILESETGWMVDRDPVQLAEKIMHVLENPQLAVEIGKNGRQHVISNWTWEQAAIRLDNYFNAVRQRY